ncbi:hypothetical protein [Streptomyces aureocirculatus]|uniref:hypothetical protein n=1 Tax=Streptomyces aureocirculatus TaxID=67275 RepID=UPI0004C97B25|nr:hypothetical protein [Streptomyces aureocirculatus]
MRGQPRGGRGAKPTAFSARLDQRGVGERVRLDRSTDADAPLVEADPQGQLRDPRAATVRPS